MQKPVAKRFPMTNLGKPIAVNIESCMSYILFTQNFICFEEVSTQQIILWLNYCFLPSREQPDPQHPGPRSKTTGRTRNTTEH